MAATLPRRQFLVRGPRHGGTVALTFDDGPHPDRTPRLLDRLAAAGIPATFFVVGREAERHPEIVARIATEGHALGHHSWSHSEPAETGAAQLRDEAVRTMDLLEQITGRRPTLFRPPKGQLTASKAIAIWRLQQRLVLWSADPRDYAMSDAAELAAWVTAHPPAGGEVVLLHDVWPWAAEALDSMASWREGGHRFVTIDAWLGAP